ncbi:unnamed protein product [Notodromas monacha]|uniref:Cation-transporting ATPase 13A3 n=1 Tax=Notodromas monacha TaxID=399045 RepID=A0A7R9BMR1_9CRUS|nr:unnamed protein product [Notodromas monacha]CAG0916994.1 unnamed protein product [Notodromas monacha]
MGQSGSSPVVLHRGTDAEIERKRKETSAAEIQVHTEPSRSQEIQGKETQQQSHKTLFFVYKKVRYVWDESTFTFSPQRAYDAICTTGILACKGSGLTAFEVQRQRGIFGENRLTIDTRPIWQIVIDEASNPFYLFQVYAALVWSLQDDYLFPTIILLISVSSIVVTVRETRRQINSLQRSDTHLLRTVRVLRDGEETTVVSTDVVPGDVLLLTTASAESVAVTCDSVLLSGDALVDEAMLTGESVPVTKVAIPEDGEEIFHFEAHRHHVLLSGTKIIQIRGKNNENAKALVIRTGFMTLQGEMIRSVLYSEGLDFAFFRKYLQIVPFFFLIGLGAMVYTAYTWVQYGAPVRKIVLFCLDILTFVVPPVLPIILTTIRATAQRRLKKKGIYCLSTMHIPAAGAIDVFCFDKTGTLTDNELGFAGAVPVVDGKCVPPANLSSLTTTDALAVGAATCHTLALVHDDLVGNETDLCLFKASNWELEPGRKMVFEDEEMVQVVALAHPQQDPEQSSAIIKVFPFDPIQQCSMAIVKRNYMRNCELFVKGSAQTVLDFCNPGSVPDELPGHLAWYEHQGYRALAMASKSLRDISPAKVHSLSRDLRFVGDPFV